MNVSVFSDEKNFIVKDKIIKKRSSWKNIGKNSKIVIFLFNITFFYKKTKRDKVLTKYLNKTKKYSKAV